jgi:hypothetical protein
MAAMLYYYDTHVLPLKACRTFLLRGRFFFYHCAFTFFEQMRNCQYQADAQRHNGDGCTDRRTISRNEGQMNLLKLFIDGLGVLGGLFVIGLAAISLLSMWAFAVHMRQCEDYE